MSVESDDRGIGQAEQKESFIRTCASSTALEMLRLGGVSEAPKFSLPNAVNWIEGHAVPRGRFEANCMVSDVLSTRRAMFRA